MMKLNLRPQDFAVAEAGELIINPEFWVTAKCPYCQDGLTRAPIWLSFDKEHPERKPKGPPREAAGSYSPSTLTWFSDRGFAPVPNEYQRCVSCNGKGARITKIPLNQLMILLGIKREPIRKVIKRRERDA